MTTKDNATPETAVSATNLVQTITAEVKTQAKAPQFTKAQLTAARSFTSIERDILEVVLQADTTYTVETAKKEIETFLAKEVK